MKKAISILLAICFLLFGAVGCAGPKQILEAVQNAKGDQTTPMAIPEVPAAENIVEEVTHDLDESAATSAPSASLGDAYSKYATAKSVAIDRITSKMNENQDLSVSMGMDILPIIMVDLSLVPLSVIGMEADSMALSMLGIQDAKIKQEGNGYSLVYQDDEVRTVELFCEYDPASESLRSTTTRDGVELLTFEFCQVGSSYAAQYYLWDETTKDYSLITNFFDDDSVVAFGMTTVTEKQGSIFKGSGYSTDFVLNKEAYWILDGNKLTVFEDGEVKTY